MAINNTIDDGGEGAYPEWEGGPLETGPVDRSAPQPPGDTGLDDTLHSLEFNEPQPGEQPEIADEGISPIPHETDQHLGEELQTLEENEPFGFQKEAAAGEPETTEVEAPDTNLLKEPPASLSEYLKKETSEPEEKKLTARQKRGQSRVPGGNPPSGEEELGSQDEGGAKDTMQDADLRNRDTMAKQSIDHMRRIEEITERLLAART